MNVLLILWATTFISSTADSSHRVSVGTSTDIEIIAMPSMEMCRKVRDTLLTNSDWRALNWGEIDVRTWEKFSTKENLRAKCVSGS